MKISMTSLGAALMVLAHAAWADNPAGTPLPTPSPTATPGVTSGMAPPYKLVMKYLAGQDLKYATDITATVTFQSKAQSGTFKGLLSTTSEQITKSVDMDGDGTLESKIDSMKVSVSLNGKTVPIPIKPEDIKSAASTATITLSPRGSFVSVNPGTSVKNTDPQQMKMGIAMMASMLSDLAILPDHPVNVGDSWRGGLNLGQQAGVVVSMKMTLNQVKPEDGKNIADIGVKVFVTAAPKNDANAKAHKGEQDSAQISGVGDLFFDIDGGYAQSFAMNLSALFKSVPGAHKFHSHTYDKTVDMPQSGSLSCHIESTLEGVSMTDTDTVTPNPPAPVPTPAATQ